MINTILIPLDGSPNSQIALDYALYMAPKLEASLRGLHVIDLYLLQGLQTTDFSASAGVLPYDAFLDAVESSLQEKARAILKSFSDRCALAGAACSDKIVVGKISDAILEESKEADWIIMARSGGHFHPQEGSRLGSVAKAVIRHGGKPVLVTPERFIEIESMALAYDGSPPAQKALALSLVVSEKAKWPITVVMVASDPRKADRLCAQVEEAAGQGAADCETVVLSGKESDEILKFIHDGSIELMVMGAYGHHPVREMLLGSTTSHIVKNSPIPVLLIR